MINIDLFVMQLHGSCQKNGIAKSQFKPWRGMQACAGLSIHCVFTLFDPPKFTTLQKSSNTPEWVFSSIGDATQPKPSEEEENLTIIKLLAEMPIPRKFNLVSDETKNLPACGRQWDIKKLSVEF